MIISSLVLQQFRSYESNSFSFDPTITLIIGPNTAGKTNLIEALYLLLVGKSFRAEKDYQLIRFGEEFSRVKGVLQNSEDTTLEVVIAKTNGGDSIGKRYFINGVAKRRIDFASFLPVVLFSPEDVDLVSGSPGKRRDFLDEVLESVDREYVNAISAYAKALRQRNALLEQARDKGGNLSKQFEYWDDLLITNGQLISQKREAFIHFLNTFQKDIFEFTILYDKSEISKERLAQYDRAELAAGNTLVGPHRDDMQISMFHNSSQSVQEVRSFGSRGQQRLAVFQLKLLQIAYVTQVTGVVPLLLLDDIFSELDAININLVLSLASKHQTVFTTTHKEFVPKELLGKVKLIEFGK